MSDQGKEHRKIRRRVIKDGMDALNKKEFSVADAVPILLMIETARIADALEELADFHVKGNIPLPQRRYCTQNINLNCQDCIDVHYITRWPDPCDTCKDGSKKAVLHPT